MHDEKQFRREYYRYSIGFILALLLTYTIYLFATQQYVQGALLGGVLLVCASLQLLVQLIIFLHVLNESKPRWTLWSIVYTIVMLLVIVVGSLWIMANMNYNMEMSPQQMNEFMLEQNKKGF